MKCRYIFMTLLAFWLPGTPMCFGEAAADALELNGATVQQLMDKCMLSEEVAQKIVELRDNLGSFQTYEDLDELGLSEDDINMLHYATTISGIAADCNC